MSLSGSPSSDAPPAPVTGSAEDDERFQLLSLTATSTPTGCVGRDWLVYHIAQGPNRITGYRRGELKTVRAEVEQIVVGLNDRRMSKKERPGPKRGRPPANASRPKEDKVSDPE